MKRSGYNPEALILKKSTKMGANRTVARFACLQATMSFLSVASQFHASHPVVSTEGSQHKRNSEASSVL